ncbi:hypothetical protein G7046_g139 [Stylonectria norvegica]|nr:hypothetical protein G7046_g139 [Stylonectria norvegica]
MTTPALDLNDPRVEHRPFAPADTDHPSCFTSRPDLGIGWRYQVPYLLAMNTQVIVPDMLGYGQTSAPHLAEEYSFKKMSAHIAHIIQEVTDEPVILGGHGWGASLAWRLALYYPRLVRGIFSFGVPFFPPRPSTRLFESAMEDSPALPYESQLASSAAQVIVTKTPSHLRGFLNAMYGGVTPDGLPGFNTREGIIEERLPNIGRSPLMTLEMIDHFVQEYSRTGMHGPMNWYRTRHINTKDERSLACRDAKTRLHIPAMLVMPGQDPMSPSSLADEQERYFTAGLRKEAVPEASHWVLIQFPKKSNGYIGEFVHDVLASEESGNEHREALATAGRGLHR